MSASTPSALARLPADLGCTHCSLGRDESFARLNFCGCSCRGCSLLHRDSLCRWCIVDRRPSTATPWGIHRSPRAWSPGSTSSMPRTTCCETPQDLTVSPTSTQPALPDMVMAVDNKPLAQLMPPWRTPGPRWLLLSRGSFDIGVIAQYSQNRYCCGLYRIWFRLVG